MMFVPFDKNLEDIKNGSYKFHSFTEYKSECTKRHKNQLKLSAALEIFNENMRVDFKM